MSDISDVENALVSMLTQIAYPDGTANPSVVLDSEGTPRNVQLYRGWPVPYQLDKDMAAGTVDVSIFPTGVEQNVTRYGLYYDEVLPRADPTLTLTIGGAGKILLEDGGYLELEDQSGDFGLEGFNTTLAVGGEVSIPQNVAVLVNNFGCSYAVQPNDTPTTIATALAALISGNTPATSSANVISIPGAYRLVPRVGGMAGVIQEVARQKRNVMVTLWCPSPDLRDNAARLFDPVLKNTNFLMMPDGTKCRLIYVSSPITDRIEKELVYRRDLIYSCEFGTTIASQVPVVVVEEIQVNINQGLLKLEGDVGNIELEDGSGVIELEDSGINLYL